MCISPRTSTIWSAPYDDAKYGWYSAKPFVTPVVPTIVDDTLAPPGKHVVNLFGGHAPYKLRNGLWENERDNFTRNVLGAIDEMRAWLFQRHHRHAGTVAAGPGGDPRSAARPHLPWRAVARPIVLPAAGAALCRLPHADGRALSLRFVDAIPGGGVSGIPGYNAAREILKDLKRRKAA